MIIKIGDPNTCITEHLIRQLIISGTVPSVKVGNKYLVNVDLLLEYLANPQTSEPECAKIRSVRS
jgi:excisionase family DNA binding protein